MSTRAECVPRLEINRPRRVSSSDADTQIGRTRGPNRVTSEEEEERRRSRRSRRSRRRRSRRRKKRKRCRL